MPAVAGWIERRVLLNYRVDGDRLSALLPPGLRPRLVRGQGIAGVCLFRLRQVRLRPLPALVGLASEHAVHFVAAEWDAADGPRTGVHILRRDTSSPFTLLPGRQGRARFQVREWPDGLSLSVVSRDGGTRVALRARVATGLNGSAFGSVAEAAALAEDESLAPEGLELRAVGWRVEVLRPDLVESSFFDDRVRFPREGIAFDSALLLRALPREPAARHSAGVAPALPRLSPT